MLGLHPCIQGQVPQSCNITTLNFEKAPLQCYLGNVIPCCTCVSVSPPAPAATYHSVSNDMCVMQHSYHCHDPTDAEWRHDYVPRLILQLLIQPTTKHLRRFIVSCGLKSFANVFPLNKYHCCWGQITIC